MRHDAVTDEYNSVSPYPLYREGASSGELEDRLAWTHPIVFSPVNRKELLVGAQFVLSSTDYGQTWKKISPDLTRNDKKSEAPSGGPIDIDASSAEVYPYVSALAVSPLDGDELWAGSVDGLVHRDHQSRRDVERDYAAGAAAVGRDHLDRTVARRQRHGVSHGLALSI